MAVSVNKTYPQQTDLSDALVSDALDDTK